MSTPRAELFKPSELAAFARRHIAYEIGMAATGTQLLHQPPGFYGEAMKNVLLEAVLVHLRLLDEFVSRKSPSHEDAVLAGDYLDEWTPTERGPLGDSRRPINKQVAHLSINRESGLRWNVLELARNVFMECDRFFRELEARSSPYIESFAVAAQSTADFLAWAEDLHLQGLDVDAPAPGVFAQTLDVSTNVIDVRVFRYPPPRYFGS